MSQYSVGTIVTSTAVPVVNQTGEAMFGRPFISRHETGVILHTTTTVTDSAGGHVVTVTGYTQPIPQY